MKEKENKITKTGKPQLAETLKDKKCQDRDCPFHGNLKFRGRTFKGTVTKKFPKRIVIEFERMIYIRKYERYAKKRTKIHARLPICIEDEIQIGDYIKVQECRPLSKIIHFVVVDKIKDSSENDSAVGTKQKKLSKTKAGKSGKSKTKSRRKKR